MRLHRSLAALLWILSTAVTAHADGPGAHRPPSPSATPPTISELGAIDAYNQGYAAIQRGDHSFALAEASSDAKEKAEARRAANAAYKESLGHFEEAVHLDASMHEAYTYLGYANRKLGDYTRSLAAYQQALKIYPDYPYAIEYQGQALLGLNRLDQARFNYLRLYALNKGQAAKLLQAMRSWVAANKNTTIDGVDVSGFSEWVARRSEATRDDVPSSSW
ncbi:tetratricopeptide repeat protein [Peristeroidobacter soli]|uniref:tetratricopeptide repeat protein n=1 Tax=Peristeroidobacter soli TaxID=2497877 RepID=UPI00101CDA7A|nr:tetratricopeptide repeat protein [Peristeroidobacter soli]